MPDRADRADRDLDLVLLGATGFTGGLTADYLAEHAPSDLRWALAGRSAEKLAAVRDRLAATRPELADLELVTVDSSDTTGLRAVAARTRVLATTVGPYVAHGEPLVAACAAEGTDYLDLTGEPEFVDRMYVAHHATAVASGARIVHACGFDSIPHDLGVLHAVRRLGDEEPITAYGVVRAVGTFSGGTFHSAIGAFSRAGEMRKAHAERRRAEPRPDGRRSRAVGAKPRRDGFLGLWLLPLPTIDPMVVARSGAALPAYGPDFRYSHFAGCQTLRYAVGGAVGVGALGVAAQVPPLRSALLSRIKQGDGPDEKRRERSRFSVDVVATTASGARVHSRVSGGDPGYTETAKMLAESALCLLRDDNPPSAGQVTTAQAMGDALLARLESAGMRFEAIA